MLLFLDELDQLVWDGAARVEKRSLASYTEEEPIFNTCQIDQHRLHLRRWRHRVGWWGGGSISLLCSGTTHKGKGCSSTSTPEATIPRQVMGFALLCRALLYLPPAHRSTHNTSRVDLSISCMTSPRPWHGGCRPLTMAHDHRGTGQADGSWSTLAFNSPAVRRLARLHKLEGTRSALRPTRLGTL